jgi:hypothetical protein
MPSRDTDAALLAERRNGWEVRRETDEKSCRCSCGKGVVVEKVSSQQESTTSELGAVLSAAYESALRARLGRRAGRRGKVHARALRSLIEMVNEMVEEAAGCEPRVLLAAAVAELDRDRGEIEADVLADGVLIEVEHEWAAFVGYLERDRGSEARRRP